MLATSSPVEPTSDFLSMLTSILGAQQWLSLAEYYGLRVGLVLVLFTLAFSTAGWASSLVRVNLLRLKFDETLTLFLAKLTWWGVMIFAAVACLSKFGVQTASFAAVIGAGGLAIGLAFQGTLSNFAAGAMLLVFRPYKVSDLVNIAGHLGKVAEIELFTTSIDTLDNRRIIIPNSEIFGAVIENITYNKARRVEVDVAVAYTVDVDEMRRVLTEAANATTEAVSEPAPAVVLKELQAQGAIWSVRVWARSTEFLDVRQAVLRQIKLHLDRNGLKIPSTQMDILLRGGNQVIEQFGRAA